MRRESRGEIDCRRIGTFLRLGRENGEGIEETRFAEKNEGRKKGGGK